MKRQVSATVIDQDAAGQRLDNFLVAHLKGIPSSRIYRAIRSGEVRVNQGRVDFAYRLKVDDKVRIPPLRNPVLQSRLKPNPFLIAELERRILLEDEDLLIIDKPSGLSVHSGAHHIGLIDIVCAMRPAVSALKLVHRLDRDTSGCLMLAKNRPTLLHLHTLLRQHKVQKQYLALVQGKWEGGEKRATAALEKTSLPSGGCIVRCHTNGKAAETLFRPLRCFQTVTLVEILLLTGRTHQARVHAAYLGHPIAGDAKYGDWKLNAAMARLGMKRLFLHSASVQFQRDHQTIGICAILNSELTQCLKQL